MTTQMFDKPQVFLAPMQGVVDHLMRDMLTRLGGFDVCVTEFVRVVDQRVSDKVFYRLCPEIDNGCLTPSGVPVRIQLLGQHPEWLAVNAEVAVAHGSPGIDLNFGCPAKTVNRHKGGAVLLKEPQALFDIVRAVREAVPADQPVCAKIRLGYEDKSLALENADAIYQAGANLLTVHARTKVEGYKPPAYWDWIAKVKSVVNIPVIANGEIWHADDAVNCMEQSNTPHIMLGRGALSLPNLAATIVNGDAPMQWEEVKQLLIDYSGFEVFGNKGKYYPNRVKQWLTYLKREYSEAEDLFMQIRRLQAAEEIVQYIQR